MESNIVFDIHHQFHIWQNSGFGVMGQNAVSHQIAGFFKM